VKNILFLQFYNYQNNKYDLTNGFSDTWDYCENKGDMLWYKLKTFQEYDSWNHLYESYENNDLPFTKGIIYICISFMNQLYQCYIWAKKYPDIKFITGGPILFRYNLNYLHFRINSPLPKNLKFINTSVEEYFNIKNYTHKWKLKIPDEIKPHDSITFNYSIESKCYWGNCIYCRHSSEKDIKLLRQRRFNYIKPIHIDHSGDCTIRLGTDSFQPKFLNKLNQYSNFNYVSFFRSSKVELNYLQNNNRDLNDFIFIVGLEYPVDRMLRYMKKGFTVDDYINNLVLLSSKNATITTMYIVGWTNLIKEDINNLEKFFIKLEGYKIPKIEESYICNDLYVQYNTNLYDKIKTGKDFKYGPFYLGHYPILNKEQKHFRQLSIDIIKNYYDN